MGLPAPNVATHCFYGLAPMSFIYDSDFPDAAPTVIYGDGDYRINKPSSETCLRWANSGYPFNRTVFQGVNHSSIMTDRAVLESIANIVGVSVNGAFPISALKTLHLAVIMLVIVAVMM